MGIRVKPHEIKVSAEEPFKHDLLERREAVENLARLVGNLHGPCALSVDAAWGFGKTTFLKIWAQHLRNQYDKPKAIYSLETRTVTGGKRSPSAALRCTAQRLIPRRLRNACVKSE